MCDITMGILTASAISAAAGVASSVAAAHAQSKAASTNTKNIIMQRNFAEADRNLQMSELSYQARQSMTQQNFETFQAMGMLNVAIGESGLEGRSMDRANQMVRTTASMQKGDTVYNLEKDYANIYAQSLGEHLTAKGQLDNIRDSLPTALETTVNIVGGLAEAAGSAMSAYGSYKQSKVTTKATKGGK